MWNPLVALWLLGLQAVETAEPFIAHDPVLYWLQRFSAAAAIAGILLVLVLMSSQRRLSDVGLKVLSVSGIVVLPLVALGLGNIVGLQQAKKVDFCASCHLTMGHFVTDMSNPDSPSLSAMHFRNRWISEAQCYTCHTSYGMFGDVQAKMRGIEDVYKYYSRTYKVPIRLHEPYKNSECLKCHDNTPKFLNNESHVDLIALFRTGEFSCLDCHGPAHSEQITHASHLNW